MNYSPIVASVHAQGTNQQAIRRILEPPMSVDFKSAEEFEQKTEAVARIPRGMGYVKCSRNLSTVDACGIIDWKYDGLTFVSENPDVEIDTALSFRIEAVEPMIQRPLDMCTQEHFLALFPLGSNQKKNML